MGARELRKPLTVIALDDSLVITTGIGVIFVAPMGCGGNATSSGEMLSDAVAVLPSPVKSTESVSPVMLAVSVPSLVPYAVGVNVTGTEIDWPAESDAGKGTLGVPVLNAPPDTTKEETVVDALAVNVSVNADDWETTVGSNDRLLPPSAGVAEGSAPKPSNVSSFVPT